MNKKIKVLFLTGHFCSEHWNGRDINEMLRRLLVETGCFEVKICEACHGLTDETFREFDVLFVNYEGKDDIVDPAIRFGEQTEEAIYRFVAAGKGIVFYHGSTWMDLDWPEEYKRLMGGYFQLRHGRRNPKNDFIIQRAKEDSTGITKYMPDSWALVEDDLFAGVTWAPGQDVQVLCTSYDSATDYEVPWFPPPHHPVDIPNGDLNQMPGINAEVPTAWANRYGDGRSVCIAIGHGDGTIKRLGFMTLFIRSLEWAATGAATILPPDRRGDKRLILWPFYDREKNPAGREA